MAFRHGGILDIQITGLKETMQALKEIDAEIPRELKRGFREDAQTILQGARGYAAALGGCGQYSGSLSIRMTGEGVRIQSTDPGAGTIEFAHPGAVALTGPRRGKPVGVPLASSAPRALVRSSLEHEFEVRDAAETRLAQVIARYM